MHDARLPDAFVAEVLARTDLSAVIGQDVRLTRAGRREFEGLCPFHTERTPSFTVVPDKGFAHCFGCSWHGDAIGYLMEARGWSFLEAVEDLAARAGMEMPGRDGPARRRTSAPPKPLPPPPQMAARDDAERTRARAFAVWQEGVTLPGTLAETYLAARGIHPETTARLQGLRFHPAVPYWWTPPRDRGEPPAHPQKLGEWPALLGAIVGPNGRFKALHQTWLADDGSNKRLIVAPTDGARLKVKKVKGAAGGGAIRLIPLPEGAEVLGTAEGIETAASVIQSLGADGLPVWALYSLGNLAGGGLGQGRPHPDRRGKFLPSIAPDPARPGWIPPPGVRRVTWFADGDGKDPAAADAIIRRGAVRFGQAGVALAVAKAPSGMDWNDVLTRGAA